MFPLLSEYVSQLANSSWFIGSMAYVIAEMASSIPDNVRLKLSLAGGTCYFIGGLFTVRVGDNALVFFKLQSTLTQDDMSLSLQTECLNIPRNVRPNHANARDNTQVGSSG